MSFDRDVPSSSPLRPAESVIAPAAQPRWRSRLLLLSILLVAILVLGGRSLAQDAAPTDLPPTPTTPADPGQAEPETIPGSAWLLPFTNLRELEPITWAIVLCSILAVTLIVQAFLRVRRPVVLPEESNAQIETFIRQRQYKELVDFTETDDSFVSRSLNPALKRAPNFSDMREALESSVAEETAEQFRKLEYINLLANIGPLLGLLGTVIGIMDAFLEMRQAGGAAEVGALAGGISTALGTTMLGLLLAIPCLAAYSVLRNKADRLTQEGAQLSEDFLMMIKPGNAPATPPAATPTPTPTPTRAAPRPVAVTGPAR